MIYEQNANLHSGNATLRPDGSPTEGWSSWEVRSNTRSGTQGECRATNKPCGRRSALMTDSGSSSLNKRVPINWPMMELFKREQSSKAKAKAKRRANKWPGGKIWDSSSCYDDTLNLICDHNQWSNFRISNCSLPNGQARERIRNCTDHLAWWAARFCNCHKVRAANLTNAAQVIERGLRSPFTSNLKFAWM